MRIEIEIKIEIEIRIDLEIAREIYCFFPGISSHSEDCCLIVLLVGILSHSEDHRENAMQSGKQSEIG